MPSEVQEQLANVLGHFRSMAEEDERAEAEAREARRGRRKEANAAACSSTLALSAASMV